MKNSIEVVEKRTHIHLDSYHKIKFTSKQEIKLVVVVMCNKLMNNLLVLSHLNIECKLWIELSKNEWKISNLH